MGVLPENSVTDLFLDAVRDLSPGGPRRPISRVLGVHGIPQVLPPLEVHGRTRWLDSRTGDAAANGRRPPVVLVVVAGDPCIDDRDPKLTPGSEVDGALLWRDQLLVVLEVKLA